MGTDRSGIYARVSSEGQSLASQLPDLERWARSAPGTVRWFRDTWTGKTMKRPGLDQLLKEAAAGELARVVVWRLDRLGRTARGLTALFEDLQSWGANLVSLREGFDLSTPAGRLQANILASVAAYETEVRAERVAAGQAAARARGQTWGGSAKGRRLKVTAEKEAAVLQLKASYQPIAQIARVTGLSRPTIYAILNANQ